MKKAILALTLILVSVTAVASADLPEIDIPYTKYVLPNGLRLIVHEDHKAPIVAVNVWYHVGSKDERPGRTGFAHLFEHLMFNGSENHNDEFFRPLEPAGATKMNGTTWLDRTNYYQNVPVSALDLTLWLESDRMGHLLGAIDQKKLDEQRGVVQNEKRQGENQPYGKVDEIIAANTYPAGHPYSWETIGSMEDLNAASLEDVKEWFRTYYGAANAVLVLAGDITPEEAKKKVEYYFGDIGPGPVLKHQKAWIAKMSGEKRAVLQDRVPQARIYKTWNIPGFATRDFALLDLTSDILANGKNSRLYKRLVYEDQIATSVQAGVGPFEIGSQLQIIATVKPGGDVRAVEKALDEELEKFLRKGPTAAELERVRTAGYASFVRGLERIDGAGGKSFILAQSEVYGGSPDFYKQQWRWVNEATPKDVQNVAKQWLSDGVFVLEVQPVPEYKVASTGADRSKLPPVGTPPDLTLPPLQRTTLSNGLKVVLAERHNAPVVDATLIIDAGYAADSLATPGTAKLTFAMLDEGTKKRTALEIAERAELLGARLGAGSSLDTSFLGVNAITNKLEESLELFSDVLLNPTFPQADFDRLKAQTLAAIQQEQTQPQGIALRLFPKLVYGEGHAYSNPFSGNGTAEAVSALQRSDLETFHKRWIRPDNATLLIVGDTTLESIVPLLEKYLGSWKAPDESLPKKNIAPVPQQTKPRVFLVNRTGAEQSLILAGYAGPPRSDPDYIALETVNTILGGNFVSRLNMNLREEKHWSYGARSGLSPAEGQGPFLVRAPVQTDKTAEAMQETLKELKDFLSGRPPTEAELAFARDSLVLTLPGANETSDGVAGSYAEVLMYGLKDSYWNDYVDVVRSLTPAQISAAAQKLIHPDALTWVIVGDLEKIEEPVRKLGFGEVKVLDTEGNVLR
ncbi:MAG: insulinase family protein [Steroidobacteraceae bacterium]|nr:insulinase family protein [Steroidobacteraceae bacterium]